MLKVKLPRPVDGTLSNGLKLVILESQPHAHHLAEHLDSLLAPARSRGHAGRGRGDRGHDDDGHADAHARQISEALADIGATVSFRRRRRRRRPWGRRRRGRRRRGTITVSALTENFDQALAIMTDILLHPTFPADEFEKWKTRQRSAARTAAHQSRHALNEKLMQVLYPDDARRFTRLTAESLE